MDAGNVDCLAGQAGEEGGRVTLPGAERYGWSLLGIGMVKRPSFALFCDSNGRCILAEKISGWRRSRLGSGADLAFAEDDPLLAGEAFEADWAAGVDLVGGNADLRTESILEAVGKAGRCVDHYRG